MQEAIEAIEAMEATHCVMGAISRGWGDGTWRKHAAGWCWCWINCLLWTQRHAPAAQQEPARDWSLPNRRPLYYATRANCPPHTVQPLCRDVFYPYSHDKEGEGDEFTTV